MERRRPDYVSEDGNVALWINTDGTANLSEKLPDGKKAYCKLKKNAAQLLPAK